MMLEEMMRSYFWSTKERDPFPFRLSNLVLIALQGYSTFRGPVLSLSELLSV